MCYDDLLSSKLFLKNMKKFIKNIIIKYMQNNIHINFKRINNLK